MRCSRQTTVLLATMVNCALRARGCSAIQSVWCDHLAIRSLRARTNSIEFDR